MSLYEKENYKSFNAFFTRHIRSELRPFDLSPEAFVSPCDAKLSVFPVDEGSRFEIKGFPIPSKAFCGIKRWQIGIAGDSALFFA